MVELEDLVIAADASAWERAGFAVEGQTCRVGSVGLHLAGRDAGRGLMRWSLRGLASADLDGLPTTISTGDPTTASGGGHPNGVLALDHVVAFTPRLDRTVIALEAAGLALRRVREGPTPGGAMRQAFFRLGDVILEVIEHPEGTAAHAETEAPARLWGLAFVVDSLEACADRLGDGLGSARDAIQPGRRIAPARRSAGLGLPVAVMTPEPEREPA